MDKRLGGLTSSIKALINRILRRYGLEIVGFSVDTSEALRFQTLLSYYRIDMILDVGANIGQYARSLRQGGYTGRIVSFEPLADAHLRLLNASRKDRLWTIAPRLAIGNTDGETVINVSRNSESSSILGMLDSHLQAAPDSKYIDTERVRIARLDTIVNQYIEGSSDILLKIDVQGFEMHVLEGANNLLPKIRGLQIELSLVPLYEGQVLFSEMLNRIVEMGFELHALAPVFADRKTGRLLQVDGIFFRTG